MSAGFGAQLLGEVHEEGLDELLHDLRVFYHENVESRDAASHNLGIDPIDELLETFIHPRPVVQRPNQQQTDPNTIPYKQDESLPDQTACESPNPEIPLQHRVLKNRTDPVVEILSVSSATGKTQLLYYLAAIAILPSQFNGNPLPGHESTIVFIDTDGRFDAERLFIIARGIARNALRNMTETIEVPGSGSAAFEAMLVSSLQHVHVFRPQSSLSLFTTLQTLDTYLLDIPRHASSKRALHSILIDSATAFFWKDKLQDEIARTEDIGRPAVDIERERHERQSFYLVDLYADLVAALKRLQQLFECAVIYTAVSWTGRPTEPRQYDSYNPLDSVLPGLPAFRSPLPAPWGLFPTLRLVVQRDSVRPFPLAMTVDEARRDASVRQEVVQRGKFVGWVNSWGRENWARPVLEGVRRLNGGQFTFNVRNEGVSFT